MVYGPHFGQNINRLDPVQKDPRDPRDEKKKKFGRMWRESNEKIPIEPKASSATIERKTIFEDHGHSSQVLKKFLELTTLEEKIGQLIFLEIEAIYDAQAQLEIELLIQTWRIGGIIIRGGDPLREKYLIERFQAVSKTPLLIARSYEYGLNSFVRGDEDFNFDSQGMGVMEVNRRAGVHIQFSENEESQEAKSFRKGIRAAGGIVGRKGVNHATIGMGSLYFSECQIEHLDFQGEAFIVKSHVSETILQLAQRVRSGKISIDSIDRRVKKLLSLKAHFFDL